MSKARQNPTTRLIKGGAAVAALALIVMLIMGYWGNYRSSGDADPTSETTATVEATDTAGGDAESTTTNDTGEDQSTGTVIVLIEGLNFRTAPSRDAELIAGLDEGTRLVHISTEDGWYKVKTAEGVEGYVSASSQYTKLEE